MCSINSNSHRKVTILKYLNILIKNTLNNSDLGFLHFVTRPIYPDKLDITLHFSALLHPATMEQNLAKEIFWGYPSSC